MRRELAPVVERLRRRPDIARLPSRALRHEIQMALMELDNEDPDNSVVIDEIERQIRLVLPRVKTALGVTDDQLAEMIGKSRPTVQAYIGGRLREQFSDEASRRLRQMIRARMDELAVLADLLDKQSKRSH